MTTKLEGLTEVRPAVAKDYDFIYATWLRGLYYGSSFVCLKCKESMPSFFREIEQEAFFKNYQSVLTKILGAATTLVCCLKEDPDVILGYSVFSTKESGATLHWVFVKSAWRKIGIGKALIPADVKNVTHLTAVGKSLKPKEWKFNPFLI